MNSSPNPEEGRSSKPVLPYVAVVSVAVLVAYPLSMGPMLWLSTHGYLSDGARQVLSRLYEPLWVVAGYTPFLKQFLHWYVRFWDG